MVINERVIEILRGYNISKKEGIPFLLAMYYGYHPDYFPERLERGVMATGILDKDDTGLIWNVDLFSDIQNPGFSWVGAEYIPLFTSVGKARHKREAITRMKKLFTDFPDVRKHEVMEATKMYLEQTEPTYVRMPHYFIQKGTGGHRTRDILDWIDQYRESVSESSENTDDTRRLR